MTQTTAHDLSEILDGMRRNGGIAEADKLARDMIAAAFAYTRIHHGARHCVVIADGLAQDFVNDVLGHRRSAKA